MPTHDYTARQALDVLLNRLEERDQGLRAEVLTAINAGKDVEERDPRRRRKPRVYRRTVRFTDGEALDVALAVLRAHFIEQPLFANSAAENFRLVALETERRTQPLSVRDSTQPGRPEHGRGQEKRLEVELETETQISGTTRPTLPIDRIPDGQVREQQSNLERLSELVSSTA